MTEDLNQNSAPESIESSVESEPTTPEKKIKNLQAIVIVMIALFLGSLAVDFVQLIRGEGFSVAKLRQTDAVETAGKTWVAYSEPLVKVQVITDDNCDTCNADDLLMGLRRIMPTVVASKVQYNSSEGQKMIQDFKIKTIPAFVFSQSVEKTDFFSKAENFFAKKDNLYYLNGGEVGIPAGKYVSLPSITGDDISVGRTDAKVQLVVFSDFQCPFCQALHETVKKVVAQYGDQIGLTFKNLPLSFHPQAENAALAGECANEQGKFWDYANKLFASQSDWGNTKDTKKFKQYAVQLKLNAAQFNKCLDDKRYLDRIEASKKEADSFGITGTPAIFVGDQFRGGAVKFEDLKAIIDPQLAK
ncbi:DsbA family protein [Patescibacteria group bacterium]|nr:MAG: DsbA family protein [Patescibacteria group bacterium]